MNTSFHKAAKMLLAVLAVTIQMCLMTTVSYAAPDVSEVVDRISSLESDIKESYDNYILYTGEAASAKADMEHISEELAKVTAELNSSKQTLSGVFKAGYSASGGQIALAIVDMGEIESTLNHSSYTRKLEEDLVEANREVRELQTSYEAKTAELSAKQSEYEEKAAAELSMQEKYEAELDEARELLAQLGSEASAEFEKLGKQEQYESIISFLESANMVTDRQRAIIQAAYNTSYSGSMLCENWVERVIRNSIDPNFKRYYSAYTNYRDNCDNFSIDTAKPGDIIYSSGTTSAYGHVGLIVGVVCGDSTLIMDNESARLGKAVPFSEWVKGATAVNEYTGTSGFWGTHTV